MAPTGNHKQELKEEESLTAVLLVETFNDNFQPLLQEDPLVNFFYFCKIFR